MITNSVTFRRARPEDAVGTLLLLKELAGHENSTQHVQVTLSQWKEYLHREDVIVFVAEVDGSLVGYVSALRRAHFWSGRDIIALDDLYVQASHRNNRIGEGLMRTMAELAGRERLTVRWEVMPANTDGRRFYNRLKARLFTKVIASWTPEQYQSTPEA